MNLNEFQEQALSYRLPSASAEYALMNLAAEVGEVFSLYAKRERDGAQSDFYLNVKKELGDALWHIAAVAQDNGFTLQDIADTNLYKLEDRFQRNKLQGSGDNR